MSAVVPHLAHQLYHANGFLGHPWKHFFLDTVLSRGFMGPGLGSVLQASAFMFIYVYIVCLLRSPLGTLAFSSRLADTKSRTSFSSSCLFLLFGSHPTPSTRLNGRLIREHFDDTIGRCWCVCKSLGVMRGRWWVQITQSSTHDAWALFPYRELPRMWPVGCYIIASRLDRQLHRWCQRTESRLCFERVLARSTQSQLFPVFPRFRPIGARQCT